MKRLAALILTVACLALVAPSAPADTFGGPVTPNLVCSACT